MTETMARRGPDAGGVWIDRHVGLGHRRLAIIDLAGGAQPMQAEEEGRICASLIYTGEVYNFVELRDELRQLGHRFKTRSDTEVVLRGPRDIPPSVHFIGALPIIPNQAPLPSWAHELDGSRKVVLVTQGTVANHDFGLLIAPTLAALANEPDLLVVVTAGGRPIDAIPRPIPSNVRLASYLPFEWVLPKIDVFVTNGGYGSVNQAMSFGIPLVTAGLTEDKADVNARVAWSGVGIDLATNEPTPQALREAIRTVLGKPNYRSRASLMADEFDGIDTRSEILRIIGQVSPISDDGLRRGEAAANKTFRCKKVAHATC